MIIKYRTHVNKSGNSYGLIVDTEKKEYRRGYSVVSFGVDFWVKKSDIDQFIKYQLELNGYTEK